MSKWIFITGGCTYIGSHIAAQLKTLTDYSVMLIDKNASKYPYITRYCDIFADEEFNSNIIKQSIHEYKPECIIHCADDISPSNGIYDPLDMWETNVVKTIDLLKTCANSRVEKFIYFSTSEIYAHTDVLKSELSRIQPLTAYSRSKLAIEHVLKDCYISYGMSNISFRLFNVAGNHHLYDLGYLVGAPKLISRIIESTINNNSVKIYGNNFNTPDKTAIRDYIHVLDLVDATISGISWLDDNQGSFMFNIASGQPHSVQEILNLSETLLGKNVHYTYEDREFHQPAINIADISLISSALEFIPKRNITDIIRDSIKWYNSPTYKQSVSVGLKYHQ